MTKNSKNSSEEGRQGQERSPAKGKKKRAPRIPKETDERVAGKGRFRGKKPKLRAAEGSDKTPGCVKLLLVLHHAMSFHV